MDVVLCTPTATPPKWLVDEHPGILQEEPDGTVRGHGSRRHYCFNSGQYREETERIVSRMVERYADSEHVVGWQTDNEFGCHGTVRCYCDDCAGAFREWLRERYGDVEALNEAWGTTFWSQQYDSFAAVDPPRHTPAEHHPSRLLDHRRFASDSVVDYHRLQADLIRDVNDDWFVTHNAMGHFPSLSAFDLAGDVDFLAWDSYPTGFVQDRRSGEASADELRAGDPDQVGFNHDLYRGATGEPFWVMEQQPGDINWPPHGPQPAEGAMRLWAHHAVAHGADALLYFRWRRCLEGQEQYHAGLRKQDGSPDRGYRAADRAADEFAGELADLAPVDAPVALLHTYDDLWALAEQPHAPDFDYWTYVGTYYRALRARGIQVDVVPPDRDLSGYAAVVAPALHLADDALAADLRDYCEAGGELLVGGRSGAKDPANKLRPAPAPGPLAALVGATVRQHESLPGTLPTRVTYEGTEYGYRTWAEWLDPDDATVVGVHETGTAAGEAAVTHAERGDGGVTYCGVWPGADLAATLAGTLLQRAGVATGERLPPGVRLAGRDGYTWVTNFTSQPLTVAGDHEFVVGDATVGPFDLSVLRAPAAAVTVER
jgi:beta-galactosidase